MRRALRCANNWLIESSVRSQLIKILIVCRTSSCERASLSSLWTSFQSWALSICSWRCRLSTETVCRGLTLMDDTVVIKQAAKSDVKYIIIISFDCLSSQARRACDERSFITRNDRWRRTKTRISRLAVFCWCHIWRVIIKRLCTLSHRMGRNQRI